MSIKHLENLESIVPDLKNRLILDIGSGRGDLLISATKAGYDIKGIEVCKGYIDESLQKAKENNLEINIVHSAGENTPFKDNYFDFLNLSEVIEHVNNPDELLFEMYRILKKDGKVYISVPSRFSFYDTHYKIFFINWLPRFLSQKILDISGKSKPRILDNGKQNLDDMYYDTYHGFYRKALVVGFDVKDIRFLKLKNRYKNGVKQKFIYAIYFLIRDFYFRAHHFLLIKK